MNKLVTLLVFIFTLNTLNAINVKLKERVFVDNNTVYLNDIVEEKNDLFKNIVVGKLNNRKLKARSNDIISKLFEENITNFNIIGKYSLVYKRGYFTKTSYKKKLSPISVLIKSIQERIGDNFEVEVNVVKSLIDVDELELYTWKLPEIIEGIKDIDKLKKVKLIHEGIIYNVDLDLKINSNIYFIKDFKSKGSLVSKSDFAVREVDIMMFKEPHLFVYDIEDYIKSVYTKDSSAGSILKHDDIKKLPDVLKGESITYFIGNGGVSVSMHGVIREDGFVGRLAKVKLSNGKVKSGVLRNEDGEYFIEAF